MNEHQKKSEALGINRSSYNYINQLWKLHCRDVEGVDFMATDFEDTVDELSEPEFDPTLDDENTLHKILETINSDPESDSPDSATKHQIWLERQLIALKRFKSDIELRLRNTSSISDDNKFQ